MTTETTTDDSVHWQLDGTTARLRTAQLTAEINLLQPNLGLGKMHYHKAAVPGSVLGVVSGNDRTKLAPSDLKDTFARGNDLVATYAETKARPFSVQVYWRATTGVNGEVVLDAILSLQTDLLESYPTLSVETNFTDAAEIPPVCAVGNDGTLVQPSGQAWSYAEATHPDDQGTLQIEQTQPARVELKRELAGDFMEKGVIRRLRVRGVFLPRENDEALAKKLLASLATEEPPLTA